MYSQKNKTLKIDYWQKSIYFTRFDCVTVSSSTRSFKIEKTQNLLKTKIFLKTKAKAKTFGFKAKAYFFEDTICQEHLAGTTRLQT